jgi:hypothetical protein
MQKRQRAPSPPISPLHGDGDAAATKISGGDVPVFDAGQQTHNMSTQVLSHASSIFYSSCGRHQCYVILLNVCIFELYLGI